MQAADNRFHSVLSTIRLCIVAAFDRTLCVVSIACQTQRGDDRSSTHQLVFEIAIESDSNSFLSSDDCAHIACMRSNLFARARMHAYVSWRSRTGELELRIRIPRVFEKRVEEISLCMCTERRSRITTIHNKNATHRVVISLTSCACPACASELATEEQSASAQPQHQQRHQRQRISV